MKKCNEKRNFESTGRHEDDGYWDYVVRKSASHVFPFQHWLDHGPLYVLASLPMRSGHVMATAVASTQLKGNGVSHIHFFSSTSLLSVLAVSSHKCSPSSPFWQQENSEAKPVTLPCLEQLPRTGLQLRALNWEQSTEYGPQRGEQCFLSQCFHMLTRLTWIFQHENQTLPSHFIDEELEMGHQRVEGPAKHSWRWLKAGGLGFRLSALLPSRLWCYWPRLWEANTKVWP